MPIPQLRLQILLKMRHPHLRHRHFVAKVKRIGFMILDTYTKEELISTLEFGYWPFYQNASGRKIYVPTQSVEAYKCAGVWMKYTSSIVGYNF